ncbi:hypothetical protein ACWT_5727 [Actinoplanes sp. SE50]|uniref:DUF6301 family protein n=1 Tax=unclassified Actinoplanes TaxID=2626549 RepID=UPI00023ED4BB|nr:MULTISPECIES: DUF6301 family protein [unclassified Actinoplanes]AEV86745.1 hypothetical protein ACPL_5858 [Actinoplanes sp. SE50/110]ATO85142.1 hypothetical protein ACWT_5727 [Actinoplanes sp. SE50]SLM02553.1 hypothetical protein ACSP50_5803 [Actinoplanes sp. SE50/110]
MAAWQALDEEQVLRAAQELLSASRLLATPAQEAAAALGWTVTDFTRRSGLLDSGYGLGPYSAYFAIDRQGRLEEVILNICERIPGSSPEIDAFKQDTFAAAASVMTGVYGKPTDLQPGKEPELWWDQGEVTLRLITTQDTVALQITPTELLQEI